MASKKLLGLNWVGQKIADGRYKVLALLGEGGMGLIFRAFDHRLETDVVIKVPTGEAARDPEFMERFRREIQSLVRLSHPHIVKIIDIGSEGDLPFVVMQFLPGGSLKDRQRPSKTGELHAMSLASLGDWLLEIAKATDFMHGQSYVHRDIKPANILFDQYGNAFLSDFGLSKILTERSENPTNASLTAAGFLVGTPNYVAPELVMGSEYDGRVDQYALAVTVYEILIGKNPFEGPSPSATMVNQTTRICPPLISLDPRIPAGVSAAVAKGMSKRPVDRHPNCTAFANAVLMAMHSSGIASAGSSQMLPIAGSQSASVTNLLRVPCPRCGKYLPLRPEFAGKKAKCAECAAPLQISDDARSVQVVDPVSAVTKVASKPVIKPHSKKETFDDFPEDDFSDDDEFSSEDLSSADDDFEESPRSGKARSKRDSDTVRNGRTVKERIPQSPKGKTGKVAKGKSKSKAAPFQVFGREVNRTVAYLSAGVLACVGIVSFLWMVTSSGKIPGYGANVKKPPVNLAATPSKPNVATPAVAPAGPAPVEIRILYGTEKEKWLQLALKKFEEEAKFKHIRVILKGMGSTEGGQAVLKWDRGEKAALDGPPHVWSPASSAYRDFIENQWRLQKNSEGSPILRAENLALSPMVFVMWKQRHAEFLKKYPAVNFRHMNEAMNQPGGWGAIAEQKEWGLFKFAHTDPEKSNSGLLALLLLAAEFSQKSELTLGDVTEETFQKWLAELERNLTRPAGSLISSTGTLMKAMVQGGPETYDCVMVYENLALEQFKAAKDQPSDLLVTYPDFNLWNENPFYVLDVPWSSAEQKKAANDFLDFLLSEPIQRLAIDYGFRPANRSISIDYPGSPWKDQQRYGIRVDVPHIGKHPKASVLSNLLGTYQRTSK